MIVDIDILRVRFAEICRTAGFVFAVLVSAGCDDGQQVVSGSSKSDRFPPPNPIENRPNPLQEYIRSNWTNGDPDATGGYLRDHIKTHGHCYTNLGNFDNAADQAQFIADNYDMFMWGGPIVGEYLRPRKALWLFESTNIPHVGSRDDTLSIITWLNDPSRNTAGYTYDNLVMHYKWDVETWQGNTPGWNPADDLDRDLCRDRAPSDPKRTAECIWDSEVKIRPDWDVLEYRYRVKIMHPGYIAATVDRTIDWWNDRQTNGFYFDCASYENWSLELGKTFTYEGMDETDPNFQMRVDLLLFVPTVIDLIERQIGVRDVVLANTVSARYTCEIPESKELALRYLENTYNENWIATNDPRSRPIDVSRRADILDCPFADWMEQDKGYVFTCYDPAASQRGKLFSLAAFYMINHQMAFYAYRMADHRVRDGEHVRGKQWNEYVDFDVGQPAVNSLGLPDFQGNLETNRFFVWITHEDYEILGREYLRDDGRRVLILVKIMARDRVEGADPTIHALPGTYQAVQADLSLGAPIDEVTLSNNDGVILVEAVE